MRQAASKVQQVITVLVVTSCVRAHRCVCVFQTLVHVTLNRVCLRNSDLWIVTVVPRCLWASEVF